MAVGEQVIQAKDGTCIRITQFHCKEPKAQVLIVHGYLEHSLRYVEFAEYLNKSSISATLFDLRGHGSSGGARAFLDDWDNYISDLSEVFATLLPQDKLDTFLLGHSNGGLIALDYILKGSGKNHLSRLKGAILTNPYVAPAEDLNPIKKFAGKFFGRVMPSLSIPANLSIEDLTSCPVKQEEHRNDPKALSNFTAGWAFECLKAQARVQEMAGSKAIEFPVLYVIGEADTVSCPDVNQRVSNQLKANDKTILIRKGERHEVLNEVNRVELFQSISKWILEKSTRA